MQKYLLFPVIGDEKLVSRVKKARQRAYNKVIEDEMTEEDRIEEFK